ncbi:MAG TPA: glycosyltransferase family 4 protein, partial [Nitrosopumilaceae archaeon]|nr:glycosyltransferase family 4 protein [Nitrosopumilaceae archaeon]
MSKICHLSSVHRGLDIRIFRKECLSLAEAGHEIHLVINASPAEVAEAASLGVTVHALRYTSNTGRLFRVLVQAFSCYRMGKRLKADLYHLHDPELMLYGLLLIWSGKRVIFDAHEDLSGSILARDWIPRFMRNFVAASARRVERFCARRFSAVVTATPYIGTLFSDTNDRVLVVNNFPILGELERQNEFSKVDRDCVCYVGGIEEIRGIKDSVKAVEIVGCQFLIAGRFGSEKLRDEISQYAGWRYVKDYGFVDRDTISKIMEQSFCGLVTLYPVPNYVNALPIKMFEYMSVGVPVIASNFPLWRRIIEGNQCGICVDPKKPEEIAAAIQYLYDRPEEVIRMGQNGRRVSERIYRWDKEASALVSLYRNLLSGEES